MIESIFNTLFSGFFFFASIAAFVLGLTEPTHNPAVAPVAGLAAGGGLFGMVFLAGPFFKAMEDLWWTMGYSSGMLFTGRCEHQWSEDYAPGDWADLLRARTLAAELFVQAYLPKPRWLYWVFGYGMLVSASLAAIIVFVLAIAPGNRPIVILAYAALLLTLVLPVPYATFLWVHHNRFCQVGRRRTRKAPLAQKEAAEVIELLGGWAHLGRRLVIDCAGSEPFVLWFGMTTTTVFTAALSFAIGVALKLWPYRGFLAVAVGAGILLLVLAFVVGRHLQTMRQALHPYRRSPCTSLPLALLLRDAAKRRDQSTPWV